MHKKSFKDFILLYSESILEHVVGRSRIGVELVTIQLTTHTTKYSGKNSLFSQSLGKIPIF